MTKDKIVVTPQPTIQNIVHALHFDLIEWRFKLCQQCLEEWSFYWEARIIFKRVRKPLETMDNLTTQLNIIGLSDSDLDEKIESIDEIVQYVSSSNRLFRKTIKHLIIRDIKLYCNNKTIELDDELKIFFPRKGRKREWIKFSHYLDFKVPELKITRFSILLLTILAISLVTLILWLTFVQTDLLIHSILSKVPLVPIIFMTAIIPFGLIALLGKTALPAKTIGELADEIISKNLSDLLTDDKKRYKEIIIKKLTEC